MIDIVIVISVLTASSAALLIFKRVKKFNVNVDFDNAKTNQMKNKR